MKRIYYSIMLRMLGLVIICCASQSVQAREHPSANANRSVIANGPAGGGRLIITRSPVLGYNVAIAITIDGVLIGPFAWGHVFEQYLSPGRHVIVASPNRLRGDWVGVLDVRRGETYNFIAKITPRQLYLDRVTTTHVQTY
jgi:hypothetical protein